MLQQETVKSDSKTRSDVLPSQTTQDFKDILPPGFDTHLVAAFFSGRGTLCTEYPATLGTPQGRGVSHGSDRSDDQCATPDLARILGLDVTVPRPMSQTRTYPGRWTHP